jgi:hypothetical protein
MPSTMASTPMIAGHHDGPRAVTERELLALFCASPWPQAGVACLIRRAPLPLCRDSTTTSPDYPPTDAAMPPAIHCRRCCPLSCTLLSLM